MIVYISAFITLAVLLTVAGQILGDSSLECNYSEDKPDTPVKLTVDTTLEFRLTNVGTAWNKVIFYTNSSAVDKTKPYEFVGSTLVDFGHHNWGDEITVTEQMVNEPYVLVIGERTNNSTIYGDFITIEFGESGLGSGDWQAACVEVSRETHGSFTMLIIVITVMAAVIVMLVVREFI